MVIVITGASSGIGWSIASYYLATCNNNLILITRNPDCIKEKLETMNPSVEPNIIKADIKNLSDIHSIENILRSYNSLDVLINNASGWHSGPLLSMPYNKIEDVTLATVVGTMNITKAVVQKMVEQKYGCIINIGSIVGTDLQPSVNTVYVAAKAAIRGFTKILRKELFGTGVKVTLLSLGRTSEEFNYDEIEKSRAKYGNTNNPVLSIIKAIEFIVSIPVESCVDELILTPIGVDY